MTIEIHNPELQALLAQRLASGQFATVEDCLLHALRTASSATPAAPPSKPQSLVEFFRSSPILGLDLDFTRDREVDTSDIPL